VPAMLPQENENAADRKQRPCARHECGAGIVTLT
jgi:hypothetical protein